MSRSNWAIHDLRHKAARWMNNDPAMSITDVQWVLGHAHLTTAQLYTVASEEDVVMQTLAHHQRRVFSPHRPATWRLRRRGIADSRSTCS
ncbi:tyrosine-type recombinase/integrase [Mycobacterium syngnathidarum]